MTVYVLIVPISVMNMKITVHQIRLIMNRLANKINVGLAMKIPVKQRKLKM